MSDHQTLLCRYRYDPLDRLSGQVSAGETDTRLFYQKSRLATQTQGARYRLVLQVDDQLLAQQQCSGKTVAVTLLATDQQRSVLQSIGDGQREASAYTAYGHLSMSSGLSSLLGFDGERRDPVTGHYLLGNGYRAFNPVLMRFNSPDSLSPFDEGGVNAYAAFRGSPVNNVDPDGDTPFPVSMALLKAVSRFKAGIRSVKRSMQAASINRHMVDARKLVNQVPLDYSDYLMVFKKRGALEEMNFRFVVNQHDLNIKGDHKFIFTDRGALIIGDYKKEYFAHPLLNYFAPKNSRVISAGHLKPQQGGLSVSDLTGHYFRSAVGTDTLTPVLKYIKSLGVNARRARAGVR